MRDHTETQPASTATETPRHVFGVICADGVNRAGIGYSTRREALTVMTFGHTCPNNPHRVIRREIERVAP